MLLLIFTKEQLQELYKNGIKAIKKSWFIKLDSWLGVEVEIEGDVNA
jgi:hypothetical protein